MRNVTKAALVCLVACLAYASPPASAVERVVLHALFKDKAIVLVDGIRRILRVGDISPEGVKLVSTDTQEEAAEIEVEGKRQELKLGAIISSFVSERGPIVLYPDQSGHYFADGQINGVGVRFIVDTGASTVTMSRATAQRVGLDYRRLGRTTYTQTAAGVVPKYSLKLEKVQLGDTTLYGVDGGVIENMQADEVLLGMSFLGRFEMKRDSEKLELLQRY